LAAARAGRFLVTPDDWTGAIRHQAEVLLDGSQPQPPSTAVDERPGSGSAASRPLLQMRLVVQADDYDEAVRFYRDQLGAQTELQIHGENGERVTILDVGRATLELSSPEQVAMIDRVEVGRRVAPALRVAFEVTDVDRTTDQLTAAGAELIAPPTVTPWQSRNARLSAPAGLHLTLFEELD
jgi:predicted enzyme related to lactoylglutathione lyase